MSKLYHIILFIVQYCFYYLITPLAVLLYKKKYPWIICERGDDARDNGYTFFKFLHSEQINYINAYYLIDKKSPDYPKVKSLGKVVKYKSLKHWLLYRVAECRMTTHLAAFAPGDFIGHYFKTHKQKGINVFLQHGITHNEFLSNYYEHNGSDLFICGAKPEYDYISKNDHYPDGNIVYTGFSRFDELHNYKVNNQILIMPSWRSYLQGLSKEEFINSKYFKAYDNLLRNTTLLNQLERNNIKLYFYMHYSLKEYIDCFSNYNSNVIIADFDHYDVQTLLKESKLLITDYSSIFFDFAYMRKPLIYYQFDVNEFYGKHYQRSYFSHERDGFGQVIDNEIDLLNEIIKSIDSNFELDKKYKDRIDNFFPLYDRNNSKRIFDAIIEKIIDKKKYKKVANKPTYLIFTGDDYGRNKQSTLGINAAYEKGYIQQTSLMVNRNESDQEYINVIPKENIIFHFNILEGNKMYDPNGEWFYYVDGDTISRKLLNSKTFFKIEQSDLEIIDEEIINQLKRYKELGYGCISFDSHGHMHNRLPIAKLLIKHCKKEGFKVARIPMNIRHNHPLFDLTYKKYIRHLYRKHFTTTDYFCSCYDLIHLNLNKYKGKTIEVMTHPFMFEYGLSNRRDVEFNLIKKYLNHFNIKLTSNIKLVSKSKKSYK